MGVASAFEDLELTVDTDALYQLAIEYLQSAYPGWLPNEASFDVIMLSAIAQMAYEQAYVASLKPQGIFRYFAEDLQGLAANPAVNATGSTTWTVTDSLGHTIPSGTQVVVADQFGFEVVDDVVIPPGSTSTAAGEVLISALDPGSAQNGNSGDVQLVDALAWLDTITLVGTTSGGADAETDADYENRLAELLRLQTPRPITPGDFEVLARQQPGVSRALALDGYDPSDGTLDHERMVTIAAVDENGAGVGTGVKTDLQALFESMREVNFIVNVIDPTSTTINVDFTATAFSTFDAASVQGDAEAAVADYLSPANWGRSTGEADDEWINEPTVRINELITVISNVSGVDYVTSVTINGSATDLEMLGGAPLPAPGTINGVVS